MNNIHEKFIAMKNKKLHYNKSIHIMNRYKPICTTKFGLLLYRKEKLYIMDVDDGGIEFICNLKIEDKRRMFCFSDFSTRLMHISVYCGIGIDDGALIAFNKGVYYVNVKEKKVEREHSFRNTGMRRPLNFVCIDNVGGCKGIYYGEYFSNEKRDKVYIWNRNEKKQWNVVYRFEHNMIRHVHAIVPDIYNDRVLISTGDLDKESAIFYTKDGFRTLEKLVSGSQMYRTCCLFPDKDGIIIVTDSPYDTNYVYHYNNNDKQIQIIKEITGPVVFYTVHKNKLVFATNVENDGRYRSYISQILRNERGPGVKDWYVHMYYGDIDSGFKEVVKMKKDIWPMIPFGFGNVHFVQEMPGNRLFFYPTAVKKYNEKLCNINL